MTTETINITMENNVPINISLISESLVSFIFAENQPINFTMEGGHIHRNKDLLDSIYYDRELKSFLINS